MSCCRQYELILTSAFLCKISFVLSGAPTELVRIPYVYKTLLNRKSLVLTSHVCLIDLVLFLLIEYLDTEPGIHVNVTRYSCAPRDRIENSSHPNSAFPKVCSVKRKLL